MSHEVPTESHVTYVVLLHNEIIHKLTTCERSCTSKSAWRLLALYTHIHTHTYLEQLKAGVEVTVPVYNRTTVEISLHSWTSIYSVPRKELDSTEV